MVEQTKTPTKEVNSKRDVNIGGGETIRVTGVYEIVQEAGEAARHDLDADKVMQVAASTLAKLPFRVGSGDHIGTIEHVHEAELGFGPDTLTLRFADASTSLAHLTMMDVNGLNFRRDPFVQGGPSSVVEFTLKQEIDVAGHKVMNARLVMPLQ